MLSVYAECFMLSVIIMSVNVECFRLSLNILSVALLCVNLLNAVALYQSRYSLKRPKNVLK